MPIHKHRTRRPRPRPTYRLARPRLIGPTYSRAGLFLPYTRLGPSLDFWHKLTYPFGWQMNLKKPGILIILILIINNYSAKYFAYKGRRPSSI